MIPTNLLIAYALFAFGIVWSYVFLSGLVFGAGWGPTGRTQLEAAARLLDLKEGDEVYDLGSGFGRAVIYFAGESKARPIGVEIDPLRRSFTLWSARRKGLEVKVLRKNLLDVDLSKAQKVFVFLTPLIMKRLEEKLKNELPRGARVVSVEHRFPVWRSAETMNNVHLYLAGTIPKVTDVEARTS